MRATKEYVDLDQKDFLTGLVKMVIEKTMLDPESQQDSNDWDNTECIVAIYKDRGMEKSRQLLYGTPEVVLATLISAIDNLATRQLMPNKKVHKLADELIKELTGLSPEERGVK
jgi:hypothetical protein